ncbi:MAG: glutamate formimidoyltransferase [Bacteroidota bacterium]
MNKSAQKSVLVECIPNFSEGRDVKVIENIADAIRSVAGVQLLHTDSGAAANRTVMTFVGTPTAVVEAAFKGIQIASEQIDMRQQKGEHPRIGATDVCPLVPIRGITLQELLPYAKQLARRVASELDIPVYCYEASAKAAYRRNLAAIRKGEYEGLAAKMQQDRWGPDFGQDFNAKSGATVIGARPFLIAYNLNLDTKSLELAQEIAQGIRTSGKWVVDNGKKVRIAGSCPALKAIAWYIAEYDKVQISMNLTDFQRTGMHQAFEACKVAASKRDIRITGSELIGLVPLAAILEAGRFYAPTQTAEQNLIEAAIQHLGLNEIQAFDPNQRIIEYCLQL